MDACSFDLTVVDVQLDWIEAAQTGHSKLNFANSGKRTELTFDHAVRMSAFCALATLVLPAAMVRLGSMQTFAAISPNGSFALHRRRIEVEDLRPNPRSLGSAVTLRQNRMRSSLLGRSGR